MVNGITGTWSILLDKSIIPTGQINKYEADVEIPQTFVSLDKLDEEEGEDVTVDDEE